MNFYLKSAVIVTLGFITIVYAFIKIFQWYKSKILIDKIPGPKGIFLLGNFLKTITIFQPDKLWNYKIYICKKYYPIFKFWNLHVPAVFITGPEDIESLIATNKNSQKGEVYRIMNHWLGNGLLTSYGTLWQKRRKILTNTFHFNILQEFVKIFHEKSQTLVKELERECNRPFTSITPHITEFTLNTICETAMGTSLNADATDQQEYKKAIYKTGKIIVYRALRPWLYPEFIFSLTKLSQVQKKLINILHKFSSKVIKDRKLEHEAVNNTKAVSNKKQMVMLDLLLNAQKFGELITDTEIREEVDTFIFEGHDTTTNAIRFMLYELSYHQSIQEKIVEEVNTVLGDFNTCPTHQQLQELHYLERVIKETLRMYPSVPLISRITSENTITHSGYTIPASTNIFILIYAMHHNENIYPDPYKFDPDRFLPENSQKRHPYAYLPFSAGPRNCIGQRFAMMELKIVMASILKKFILKPADPEHYLKFVIDMVLRIDNDLKIKLEYRQ